MSFGMIFSIIIIIAIISVAFYTIGFFLNTRDCTDIALFHKDLQERIDKSWNSEITRDTFEGRLPSSIEQVCFGDDGFSGAGEIYESFDDLYPRSFKPNLFIYPSEKSCDQAYVEIEHITLEEFQNQFGCFPVENGRVLIRLEKSNTDPLVRILR